MTEALKLIAISGLPATGKSTLSLALAKQLAFPLFGKDHFDTILYNDKLSNGSSLTAYHLMLETAKLQLSLGISVIVEAVFPLQGFRDSLYQIAAEHHAKLYILHTYFADEALHRQRLEARPIHIPWNPVDWERVQALREIFIAWQSDQALFLDSANSLEYNLNTAIVYISA